MILKTLSLPPFLLCIIQDKATEPPFSGEYNKLAEEGTYLCRQCGLALFRSSFQFSSSCGWPSFDEEITGTVGYVIDADGKRTEIICERCKAHLGHVFKGEGFTEKNVRHCVNSLSLDFVTDTSVEDTEEAIFSGGCFWGVEHFLKKLSGVVKTEVGYIGGKEEHPSYEKICAGHTGYLEAVRVVFDFKKISFKTLTEYFFEIHDPTQKDGQGPDLGEQYLSAIFYFNDTQKNIALDLIQQLTQKGYSVVTQLRQVRPFWRAEEFHQDYYQKTRKLPYCHHYVKRF